MSLLYFWGWCFKSCKMCEYQRLLFHHKFTIYAWNYRLSGADNWWTRSWAWTRWSLQKSHKEMSFIYNWFFASLPVSTVTICHAKFRGVVIIAVIRIPVGFISIGWLVAEKIANWCGNVWYQLLFRFAVCRSVEERYFIEAEQQRDLIHYHTNVLFPRQPTNRLK